MTPTTEPNAREAEARAKALMVAEVIKSQVTPIIEGIAHDRSGDVIQQLKPRDEDYQKVFLRDAVEVARTGYAAMWAAPPDIAYPSPSQSEIRVYVAPAGMLASDNELSRHFPGGYRAIAHLLNPHRVWVAWKYTRPGETSGLAYNGLVWCDDHWSWFPKPYRVLKDLVA